MITQTHIPAEDSYTALLLQYAAGSLDQAQRLVVATHLALSPQARRIVRRYEELGAAIMQQCCEPVSMSPRSLDSVLSRLETARPAPAQEKPQPQTMMLGDLELPACLYEALRAHAMLEQMRWRRLYEGIESLDLPIRSRRSRAYFVRFEPGIAAPPPPRPVMQITLVMKGSYYDETGEYHYGDLVITEREERPRHIEACRSQGCVNLTVSSGPQARLHGLAALLQSLLRS